MNPHNRSEDKAFVGVVPRADPRSPIDKAHLPTVVPRADPRSPIDKAFVGVVPRADPLHPQTR